MIKESNPKCFACGACENVCPVAAISIIENDYGFLTPKINKDVCIHCDRCEKVCPLILDSTSFNTPVKGYAGINNNDEQILLETSGGLFGVFSNEVFDESGVVSGCYLDDHNNASHIIIKNRNELYLLYGSKYIQSNIGKTFRNIKKHLENGTMVLFCGTPCQVLGLKSFLSKDYENLITIDLICHGIASNLLFREYLSFIEKMHFGSKVRKFKFRNKKYGWGQSLSYVLEKKKKSIEYNVPPILSSFYTTYLDGNASRDSCYSCQFHSKSRPGDISIGDFWGIERFYPNINRKRGVSSILLNSDKGIRFFHKCQSQLTLYEVNIDDIVSCQKSLRKSMQYTETREKVLDYAKSGKYYKLFITHIHENFINYFRTLGSLLIHRKLKRRLGKD